MTTPEPAPSSQAWRIPRASSTACSLGRERRVGALDLAGVDQGLAVEAQLAALPALGQEAVGVLHVVVDAVEDRLAGRPGRRAAPGRGRSAAAARPGTCSAYSSLARSLVPITSTVSRSLARGDLLGVQHRGRRLDHRPELRVVRGAVPRHRVDERADRVGAVHLRHDDRVRAGGAGGGQVVVVPLGVGAVDPDRHLARAVLAATRPPRRRPRARPAWRRGRPRPRGRGSARRRGSTWPSPAPARWSAGM